MKCPLCAREMTRMVASAASSHNDDSGNHETLYYCDKHGVMNKTTDLVETVDQIAKGK